MPLAAERLGARGRAAAAGSRRPAGRALAKYHATYSRRAKYKLMCSAAARSRVLPPMTPSMAPPSPAPFSHAGHWARLLRATDQFQLVQGAEKLAVCASARLYMPSPTRRTQWTARATRNVPDAAPLRTASSALSSCLGSGESVMSKRSNPGAGDAGAARCSFRRAPRPCASGFPFPVAGITSCCPAIFRTGAEPWHPVFARFGRKKWAEGHRARPNCARPAHRGVPQLGVG